MNRARPMAVRLKIVESICGAVSNHVIYFILLTQNADYLC